MYTVKQLESETTAARTTTTSHSSSNHSNISYSSSENCKSSNNRNNNSITITRINKDVKEVATRYPATYSVHAKTLINVLLTAIPTSSDT